MSTFTGFSEEDIRRIKNRDDVPQKDSELNSSNAKKINKIGTKPKKVTHQYKLPILQRQISDEGLDSAVFDKCKLSIKTPMSPSDMININNKDDDDNNIENSSDREINNDSENSENYDITSEPTANTENNIKINVKPTLNESTYVDHKPDIVRGVELHTDDDLQCHKMKLEDLQLQQRLMEEQNKKRKEMLAKALADRTKQTTEEVMKLEKIKKELQILDGQFSQDVSMLRKKIDQACLSYADAEKHYLRVEKEFLQAKIHLQKEKEKKELLTEHLCALITHNETRKAQKLETLMLELANAKRNVCEKEISVNDETPVIVDGVDQKTGKIVDINIGS